MKRLADSEIKSMVKHNGVDINAKLYGMCGTNRKATKQKTITLHLGNWYLRQLKKKRVKITNSSREVTTTGLGFEERSDKLLDFGYYNMDCIEGMKQFPDKYFDLAIVDPPYGINVKTNMGRRKGAKDNRNPPAEWDSSTPNEQYFNELFRISKKQVIWGGNYFTLPPTKCFLIWRKSQISEDVSFSMCEYAWTNFDGTAKEWVGMSNEKGRIHPTQKPVALYEWILSRYAKDGDIILDTHVGSASSLIACYNTNHKFVGFELDKHYYELSKARLETEMSQMRLFDFI